MDRQQNPVITGNVAVDMIYGCLAHYKKFGQKVVRVTLSHRHWTAFERFMRDEAPNLEFDDAVQFNDVLVERGSVMQNEHLIPTTRKPLAIA